MLVARERPDGGVDLVRALTLRARCFSVAPWREEDACSSCSCGASDARSRYVRLTEQHQKWSSKSKWSKWRHFQWSHAVLFYSAASHAHAVEHCQALWQNGHKWYPAYCDRLLQKFGVRPLSISKSRRPAVTYGWGWTEWGAWSDDCPKSCARRCQVRSGRKLNLKECSS